MLTSLRALFGGKVVPLHTNIVYKQLLKSKRYEDFTH